MGKDGPKSGFPEVSKKWLCEIWKVVLCSQKLRYVILSACRHFPEQIDDFALLGLLLVYAVEGKPLASL